MKKVLFISLLTTIVLCGCQEKDLDYHQYKSKAFTATIVDNFGDTKTSIDGQGNVLWKKGNQVSIFNGSTINQQYQVTDSSDGMTAADMNPVSSPGFVAGSEIDNNVAYYPYSSTAAIAKNEGAYIISGIALPSTQNYSPGSFGDGAFPMVAVTSSTSDQNLKFKNILGCLKLQLKGTASITSISVTGNNNEILCGAASLTAANGGTPSINLTDESSKTVTLDCGTGVSLNTSTATAFVIALPPMAMTGGFTVKVRDTEGKQMEIKTTKSQTITRSNILKMPEVNYQGNKDKDPEEPTIEAVDLGLSVKWASCNVGASKPEEYGGYYSWGESQTKSDYDWDTYKWCNGSSKTMTKYCIHSKEGTVDNKTVLEPDDDVAHVKWGGSWRMPTDTEWTELIDNSTWTWTTLAGVNGMLVTSKKEGYTDKSIFLPAAGARDNSSSMGDSAGILGCYWSSSLDKDYSSRAWGPCFYSGFFAGGGSGRYLGGTVRPVSE